MYLNNVPKTSKPQEVMKRTSRNSLGTVPRNNEVVSIISSSATNEALEKIIDGKELEMVNFEKHIQ